MNINGIFIQFLEDHGCKEQYLANKAEDRGYPDFCTDDNLNAIIPAGSIDQFISGIFVWACTPEGDAYWRDIDHKWRIYVKQNQLDI